MWSTNARFCLQCAGPLTAREVEGRSRLGCSRCDFVLYANPASAAAGVVLDGAGRVLLVQRAIEPYREHWALPAGYQEADEDPSWTVVREVREETGIEVAVVRLLDLLYIPEDPRKPVPAERRCAVRGARRARGGLVRARQPSAQARLPERAAHPRSARAGRGSPSLAHLRLA